MARVGFDPSTVDDASATFTPGQIYSYNGKRYRYVRVMPAAAGGDTTNGCVMRFTATANELTKYALAGTGAPALSDLAAGGVTCGVISGGQYGFVQVQGVHTSVDAESTVTAGDALRASGTAGSPDGRATTLNAAAAKGIGIALTTAAANKISADLQIG